MQWPELLLLAAISAAALSVLAPSWAGHRRQLLAVSLVLGSAEGWYRVAPWQMAPVAAAWLLLVLWDRGARDPLRPRPIAAGLALALISTAIGLLIVLPFFSLPRPTGRYAVGSRIVTLTDPTRSLAGDAMVSSTAKQPLRMLEVQFWYPAEAGFHGVSQRYVRAAEVRPLLAYQAGIRTNSTAEAPLSSAGAPFPMLLYGPSWGSRRTVDTFLCEELASHGYIVVAIDHPLNAARVLLPGGAVIKSDRANALSNVNASSSAGILALWSDELARWIADDRFVLGLLAAANNSAATASGGRAPLDWLDHRLDLSRVGAFGHSFGGASSLAMLRPETGQAIPPVRAAVNLDGWTFQALDQRGAQPMLTLYAGAPFNPAAPPEPGVEGELDRTDRAAVEASIQRFGGTLAYIPCTQHLDFTDQTLISPFQRLTYTGPMPGERIRTITRGLVVGFFDRTLKDSQAPRTAYPEVQLISRERRTGR